MSYPSVEALIARYAPGLRLDADAVRAVAMGEGGLRWGAVGDRGHAYGPFQMNDAGGVLTGRFGSPAARAAYANSPEGVLEALRAMAKVAGGRRGGDAVRAIITGYERPADKATSIRNALARLGASDVSGGSEPVPAAAAAPGSAAASPAPDGRRELALALIQANQRGENLGADVLGPLARNLRQPTEAPSFAGPAVRGEDPRGKTPGSLTELFYDPLGGIKNGREIGPVGGHTGHVHVGFSDERMRYAALQLARRLGLTIREDGVYDRVDPVHAEGSHHYETFPGGRKARAADVSGPSAQMASYYRRMKQLYGGR